jgi:hypothetical protein
MNNTQPRQQTTDYAMLSGLIIALCGCTVISVVFGVAGSLFAGLAFGLMFGFLGGAWLVRRPRRPRHWQAIDRDAPPARQAQPQPPPAQRNISPVSNEW